MDKITIDKINKIKVIDIKYEPKENRYSILEENSERKQITRKEFFSLAKQLRSLKI